MSGTVEGVLRKVRLSRCALAGLLVAFIALGSLAAPAYAEDIVVKPSDETVTNSTTLQDDDDLVLSIDGASNTYEVVGYLEYDGTNSTHDLKAGIQTTNGVGTCHSVGVGAAGTAADGVNTMTASSTFAWDTSTTKRVAAYRCQYRVTTNATHQVKFRWSGNASSVGNSTTVLAGSVLRVRSLDEAYGGGAENLSDLLDVDLTGVTTGSILEYDGAAWVVGADDEGTGGGCEDCVTQEDFDAYVLASHTCGGEGQDPCTVSCSDCEGGGGEVMLSGVDANRLDLTWSGVWFVGGIVLCFLVVRLFERTWSHFRP